MRFTSTNHQSQMFPFFIRQGDRSQTRTESALTSLPLKVTLRNNTIAVVQIPYSLCGTDYKGLHINIACMNWLICLNYCGGLLQRNYREKGGIILKEITIMIKLQKPTI